MALSHFAAARVDIAVLEIGLGGRLDAVNTVTPVVSAITPISLEHTDVLGTTLTAIAGHVGSHAGVAGVHQTTRAVVVEQQEPGSGGHRARDRDAPALSP